MKKVKEWLKEKKVKKILDEASKISLEQDALFEIVCIDEEGVINTVKSIDGDYFSLGDYKLRDSDEIFTITEFDKNLKNFNFTTKKNDITISTGLSLITDISLIDSDTIEYAGILAKKKKELEKIVGDNQTVFFSKELLQDLEKLHSLNLREEIKKTIFDTEN